jgi:hypothetical protein
LNFLASFFVSRQRMKWGLGGKAPISYNKHINSLLSLSFKYCH